MSLDGGLTWLPENTAIIGSLELRETEVITEGGYEAFAKVSPEKSNTNVALPVGTVIVRLKPTVNDPEGISIGGAIRSLGFEGIGGEQHVGHGGEATRRRPSGSIRPGRGPIRRPVPGMGMELSSRRARVRSVSKSSSGKRRKKPGRMPGGGATVTGSVKERLRSMASSTSPTSL